MTGTGANILGSLVPFLAPRRLPPESSWARVVSVSPLRVQLAGSDEVADGSPLSLVPHGELYVGAKVRMEWMGATMLVSGLARGGAHDTQAAADAKAATDAEKAAADAEAAELAWKALPVATPWETYSAFGGPAYRIEKGVARLSGTYRNPSSSTTTAGGSAQPFATLPPEIRPYRSKLITMTTATGGALGYATSAGLLYINTQVGAGGWVSVEGITYRL